MCYENESDVFDMSDDFNLFCSVCLRSSVCEKHSINNFNKVTTETICAFCQDSKWVEEKQLFLQRNQELLEKVQLFFCFIFTFINIELVVLSLSRVRCQVFEALSFG